MMIWYDLLCSWYLQCFVISSLINSHFLHLSQDHDEFFQDIGEPVLHTCFAVQLMHIEMHSQSRSPRDAPTKPHLILAAWAESCCEAEVWLCGETCERQIAIAPQLSP